MSDNTPKRARRTSAVPREVVISIDNFERKASFAIGGLAILMSLLYLLARMASPSILKAHWVNDTVKPLANGKCPTHYLLHDSLCRFHQYYPAVDWLRMLMILAVGGLAIIFFAWRKRRSGIAVAALMLGFPTGVPGLIFFFLGGWLILRAYRLQKYGDATMVGSARKAREMAEARRAGRTYTPTAAPGTDVASPRPAPEPSARYTPKKSRGKKR